MPTCLLGLGSNLGNREATLHAALTEIAALPDVQVSRHSRWYPSRPVGGLPNQDEFLNAAAVIETKVAPLLLLNELRDIETRHGRTPGQRWSPRTLDIDILLYGHEVMETQMLTLPHPRMSFRRFVLEPAAEIAPKMLHPTIGWPIERLLLHLNMAADQLALLSPMTDLRMRLADVLHERFTTQVIDPPSFANVEHHWPAVWTTWLAIPSPPNKPEPAVRTKPALPYAAAAFPKLTIAIDAAPPAQADKVRWSTLLHQPGRGPLLHLKTADPAEVAAEATAALEAVWPDLGPSNANRLESK
ncbi:MAG TPA: 2-amino-4-hydroxy-6-hydroxymethyldihydropteridine diphosphokinase [Lacipirellulaceae bacterium]|nr:2-amino-4-hydroxy-6-hydroxymethyldihydropteridine diphosphokinase [Lacipirellulaceae bacterium]